MRPANWYPPIELSSAQEKVVSRIKRAKLFTFVCHNRHEIFDDGFEKELVTLFKDSSVGHNNKTWRSSLMAPQSCVGGRLSYRRIAIEDAQMGHGRQSRKQRFDGYKRHVLRDLDIDLVRAVGLTPANLPQASVTDEIIADLKDQSVNLRELHIDRAYLASNLVKHRSEDLSIVCKAWPVRNGERFTKHAFTLDWRDQQIH